MAYERLTGPIGAVRADYSAALVAQTVYASASGKGKGIREFMPIWDSGDE
jgi:hypothetical protein